MAKVSLRGYIIDIDHLIDNNQLDEAIAHCIHILSNYPKHGDTYRLLGKAFLERQRYRDAADMFMRVLAIFPDDFVAHIGISIVREEQSDLDHAIFHMERAFEVQPSNTAIQDELKRLYGKRDGVIPAKIRLTHSALARLYSKGDLNQQAVGELRVALNESPVRSDILAQLAELYTKENQTSDAIETCNKLIERLPYCFGALTVLTRLLPGTPFAQDVPMYKSRLDELDPYNAFKSSITQPLSEVSDDSVSIEPLIWSPEAQVAVNMVDWASSMGINLVEPQEYDPSMILTKTSDSVNPQISDTPTKPKIRQPKSSSSPVDTPADKLPDWMEAAGWSKSDQSADNYPGPSESEHHIANEPSKKTDKLHSLADTTSLENSSTPEIYANLHSTDGVSDTFESDPSQGTPINHDDSENRDSATDLSPGAIPEWLRSIAPPEYLDNKPQLDQPAISVSKNTSDEAFSSIFPTKETTNLKTEPPASPMAESDANFDTVSKDRLSTEVSSGDEEQILSLTDKFIASAGNESHRDMEGDLKKNGIADSTEENIKLDIPEPVIPSDDISHEIDPLANLRMSFQTDESQTGLSVTGPVQSVAPQLPAESDEQADNSAIKHAEEIPDWLLTLAATTETTEPSPDNTSRDKLPSWLQDFEQKIDEQPASQSPLTMPSIKEAPTTELHPDRLTPDIVGPNEVTMPEEIYSSEEESKEKQQPDLTSPPPHTPLSTDNS
ncbi:MAG: tetratricopeptide repeat protein, partial [Anaerolineaceae bacterium]